MEGYMRQHLKQAKLMVVRAPREREQAVLSGRADIFIADYPYSRKVLRFYDWARLVEPEELNAPRPFRYAYAIAKDQPVWLSRVNAFVAQIKSDGRLEAAAKKYDLLPAVVRPQGQLNQLVFDGIAHQTGGSLDIQFGLDVLPMGLNGAHRDAQLPSNLLVVAPFASCRSTVSSLGGEYLAGRGTSLGGGASKGLNKLREAPALK